MSFKCGGDAPFLVKFVDRVRWWGVRRLGAFCLAVLLAESMLRHISQHVCNAPASSGRPLVLPLDTADGAQQTPTPRAGRQAGSTRARARAMPRSAPLVALLAAAQLDCCRSAAAGGGSAHPIPTVPTWPRAPLATATALKADDTATGRPMPPWPYAAAPGHGGFPGIAWFGANESGAENRAQMDVTFANYSMIVFGWQDWLRGTDFNGELDAMVEQAQAVKRQHPSAAVIVYIDGLRVQPFYKVLRRIMYDPRYEDFFLRQPAETNTSGFIPADTYCGQSGNPWGSTKCMCWYWNWFNVRAARPLCSFAPRAWAQAARCPVLLIRNALPSGLRRGFLPQRAAAPASAQGRHRRSDTAGI